MVGVNWVRIGAPPQLAKDNKTSKKLICPACLTLHSLKTLPEHIAFAHIQKKCHQVARCINPKCELEYKDMFSGAFVTSHLCNKKTEHRLLVAHQICEHRAESQGISDSLMEIAVHLGFVDEKGCSVNGVSGQERLDAFKKTHLPINKLLVHYRSRSPKIACFVKNHYDEEKRNRAYYDIGGGGAMDEEQYPINPRSPANYARSPSQLSGRSPTPNGRMSRSPGPFGRARSRTPVLRSRSPGNDEPIRAMGGTFIRRPGDEDRPSRSNAATGATRSGRSLKRGVTGQVKTEIKMELFDPTMCNMDDDEIFEVAVGRANGGAGGLVGGPGRNGLGAQRALTPPNSPPTMPVTRSASKMVTANGNNGLSSASKSLYDPRLNGQAFQHAPPPPPPPPQSMPSPPKKTNAGIGRGFAQDGPRANGNFQQKPPPPPPPPQPSRPPPGRIDKPILSSDYKQYHNPGQYPVQMAQPHASSHYHAYPQHSSAYPTDPHYDYYMACQAYAAQNYPPPGGQWNGWAPPASAQHSQNASYPYNNPHNQQPSSSHTTWSDPRILPDNEPGPSRSTRGQLQQRSSNPVHPMPNPDIDKICAGDATAVRGDPRRDNRRR